MCSVACREHMRMQGILMHAEEAAQVYVQWICTYIQLYLQIILKCIFTSQKADSHTLQVKPLKSGWGARWGRVLPHKPSSPEPLKSPRWGTWHRFRHLGRGCHAFNGQQKQLYLLHTRKGLATLPAQAGIIQSLIQKAREVQVASQGLATVLCPLSVLTEVSCDCQLTIEFSWHTWSLCWCLGVGLKLRHGGQDHPLFSQPSSKTRDPRKRMQWKPGAAPILSRDKATNVSQSLGAAKVSSAHFTSKRWYFHWVMQVKLERCLQE